MEERSHHEGGDGKHKGKEDNFVFKPLSVINQLLKMG